MNFVYVCRSDVWLWQMVIQDERSNIKKMEKLSLDQSSIDRKKAEYDRSVRYAVRKYAQLPTVSDVISNGNRSFEGRDLTLLDRCKIIDKVKGSVAGSGVTFVNNYASVYGHLSETVHGTSRALSSVYIEDAESISLDLYGTSGNTGWIATLSAYLYYMDILSHYHSKVLGGVEIPEAIMDSYREVTDFTRRRVAES